jgi:putative ABC transport system ATP-binding protein
MGLMRKLVDERGVSVIVATHDPILIEMADRAVELRDGTVVADSGVSLAAAAGANR